MLATCTNTAVGQDIPRSVGYLQLSTYSSAIHKSITELDPTRNGPDTRLMPAFTLPIVVRTSGGDIRLAIDLVGATPWSRVSGDIAAAAGLEAGNALYLGAGIVDDSWMLGVPPLLAGVILSDRPIDRPSFGGLLQLACIAGPDAGRSLTVMDRPVVVGRDRDADLAIRDPNCRSSTPDSRPRRRESCSPTSGRPTGS